MRIILHVDMDCFFAQVEEVLNPELRGNPVIVGADPKNGTGRGVVCTCNYEARKYGIKSAMPISIAYRKCPQGIFLPVAMGIYGDVSRNIMRLVPSLGDKFQQVSIDEAYLDISSSGNYEKAEKIGRKVKQKILDLTGLTCSVGIGPNKLIAKLAASENKPNGLTIIKPNEVKHFLNPKPVRSLFGIGPKTAEKLNQLGYQKIEDVAKETLETLQHFFGNWGEYLYNASRGVDEREVKSRGVAKSIGKERTFQRDTNNIAELRETVDDLVRQVFGRLRRKDMAFKTITLKYRYEGFETHTKSKTLQNHTQSIKTLRKVAQEHLEAFLSDKRKCRLVGLSVSTLETLKNIQEEKKPCNRTLLSFMATQDTSQHRERQQTSSENSEMIKPSAHWALQVSCSFKPHLNQGKSSKKSKRHTSTIHRHYPRQIHGYP